MNEQERREEIARLKHDYTTLEIERKRHMDKKAKIETDMHVIQCALEDYDESIPTC